MGSPLEGPNPLRPYYVPPSIGLPGKAEALAKSAPAAPSASVTRIGRDIISDFDYSDYLGDSSPSVVDSVRQLLEEALWRYSRTLMSQPFEVAKTILQVYVAEDEDEKAEMVQETRGEGQQARDEYSDDVCGILVMFAWVNGDRTGILTFYRSRRLSLIPTTRAIILHRLRSLLGHLPLLTVVALPAA